MIKIFALTTRGIESISADEMSRLAGMTIQQVTYRKIFADYFGGLAALENLQTIDDIFLEIARWDGIVRQRSALECIQTNSAHLNLDTAIALLSSLRGIAKHPSLSITANFVGKRNYNTEEIKEAVWQGLAPHYAWNYLPEEHKTDINLRLFIEHELAWIGLRVGVNPLYKRPYKHTHVTGSLKPPVAAAMVRLAFPAYGGILCDPCCGAGTIPIEASAGGLCTLGGDIDPGALQAAHANAREANLELTFQLWDARRLPLANECIDGVAVNLPWGRQVAINNDLSSFYHETINEIVRILKPNRRAVLLTSLPELIIHQQLSLIDKREISLFGQNPFLVACERH